MIMLMFILIVILGISWDHVRREKFFLIPDRFKTQKMCIRAVKTGPWRGCTVSLIGLCCYKKCGVKTLMIMIILLGGAMHNKNERLKEQK